MDPTLFLAFIAATVLLALFPGPNMALIVSTSITHGTRFGLLTLVGTSAALATQLALVALGMSTLLGAAGYWFEILRWIGAVYLIWLGVQAWRAPPVSLDGDASVTRPTARAMVMRGLLVSLTNPKTLLFFGAFFPQFIAPGHDLGPQLALMSLTFLSIVVGLDSIWATIAGRMRHAIAERGQLLNRVSGGLLVGAGVGLAAVRSR